MVLFFMSGKGLTVSRLRRILCTLDKAGYGDFPVCFGYDSDFAFTTPCCVYKIDDSPNINRGVYFFESEF